MRHAVHLDETCNMISFEVVIDKGMNCRDVVRYD